jgi:hypothetical protein
MLRHQPEPLGQLNHGRVFAVWRPQVATRCLPSYRQAIDPIVDRGKQGKHYNALTCRFVQPEVGFEPTTFRLRIGPQPSGWTRLGPTWLLRCGTGSIQSRPVVPGSSVWIAREVATGLGERSTVSLAQAPRPSDRDRMLTVSALRSTSVSRRANRPLPPVERPRCGSRSRSCGRGSPRPGRCAATARPASDDGSAEGVHDQGFTKTAPPWHIDSSFPERGIIRGDELLWVGRGALGSLAGLLTLGSGG